MPKTLARRAEVEPITIGKFRLTETGLDTSGRPSFDEWQGVGDFIKRTHRASGFWLADWLRYGDSREDWTDRIDQAVDATTLSEKTLINIRSVGRIDPARRRAGVDFSHHVEVAQLPPAEQEEWLERTETEGWSVRELRENIRASRRRRVVDGQAALVGMYRVIYADPPWQYRDSGATADGSLGKAERHYKTLSMEELCKLPVKAHAMPDAVLWLWVTAPMLFERPGPRDIIEAWGFEPKSGIIWDKVLGMPGRFVQVQHEHLIIAERGSCPPDVPTPKPKSVATERRSDEHSRKPSAFRKMIERLYTTGPYLELFASTRHEGWDAFGDDARLWGAER